MLTLESGLPLALVEVFTMQRLETSAYVKNNSEFFTVEVKLFNKCGVNSYDH
jgi:hypothetical protein